MKSITLPLLPLALVLATVHAGCSNDDPATDPETDAGTDSAVPVDTPPTPDAGSHDDGGDGDGVCTTLANVGSPVGETAGGDTKPTPMGGTIADGVYVLTKHEVYSPSSPDSNTRRHIWRFSGGAVEAVTEHVSRPEVRAAGTFTTQDNELRITVACPQASATVLPYTATPDTIIMFDQNDQSDVFTYTKQ